MSQLFSKIRRKMLTEYNFSKYLAYAIGEILIIIIGVLIAVKINNLNEKKKIDELEIQYLAVIENGLKSDLKDVKYNLSWHEEIFENQLIFIKWLESDSDINDSLLSSFVKSLKASTFLKSEGPYETLKEFGLNKITNKSIKNSIIALYDVEYPFYATILNEYHEELKKLMSVGYKYLSEYSYARDDTKMHPIHISQMKKDHAFIFRYKTLKNFNKIVIYQNNKMKDKLEMTIDAIEVELQKRQ